jgi:uridine kinase
VVHLDDFLNPRAVRHHLGRTSPAGFFLDTYDLEAFRRLVLDPVGRSGAARVVTQALDHTVDAPVVVPAVTVPAGAVVLVEGMFLHRDELRAHWDLSVFLDVPFSVTAQRMALRDGTEPDPEHPSMRRYVEGQRIYLAQCRPQTRADVVVDNA